METELQLQNFDESEWEKHNNYYYKNTGTGKIIHEETFNKKLRRAYIWEQAVAYVSEELQDVAGRWEEHGGPSDEACVEELRAKLQQLQ